MAKNNNLGDFLKDLADTIRTKKGKTGTINPQDFSSEIESIQTGTDTSDATATASDLLSGKTAYGASGKITGSLQKQTKSVSIVTNKQTVIQPDAGKLLETVVVTTNVQPVTQEKTVAITENGTTEITPDIGKVLSKVTATVNVPSSGAELNVAYGDTAPTDTSKLWIKSSEPSEITFGQQIKSKQLSGFTALNVSNFSSSDRTSIGVIGKTIYFNNDITYSTIFYYNTETKEYDALNGTLGTEEYRPAIAVVNDTLYGFTTTNTELHVYVYNFSSSAWTLLTNLGEGYNEVYSPCVAGSKVYLVPGTETGNTVDDSIVIFDVITKTTQKIGNVSSINDYYGTLAGDKLIYVNTTGSGGGFIIDTQTNTVSYKGYYAYSAIMAYDNIYLFNTDGTNTISKLDNSYDEETLGITVPNNQNVWGTAMVDGVLYLLCTDDVYTAQWADSLSTNDIFVKESLTQNLFDLMSSPTRVEIGIDKVYKGNASNNAELCDAYLHDGMNWVNVNTGEALVAKFTINGTISGGSVTFPTYTLTKKDGTVENGTCNGVEIDPASVNKLIIHTDGYAMNGYTVQVFDSSDSQLYSSSATDVDITAYITGGGYCNADNSLCFVEGTLVTLADRTTKPIEDITYDDDLLVWNFYDSKFDSAKPFWIMKEKTADKYLKVSFSDGKELKSVGNNKGYHRMFNKEAGEFTHLGTEATPIGTTTLADDGTYPTIVKEEVVKQNVKYYNLATDKHFNFFANGILVSCRLSNKYHIENMKYVGEPRDLDEENYYKHLEANRK